MKHRLFLSYTVLLGLVLGGCGEARDTEKDVSQQTGDANTAAAADAPMEPGHASLDPAALFAERCASCHLGTVPKAPHVVKFQIIGRDAIYDSMKNGVMRPQAEGLSEDELQTLADFLGGTTRASTPVRMCAKEDMPALSGRPAFEGWGLTLKGTRHIDAQIAGLRKADVPNLKLKWAFAYPGATRARSQPTFFAGMVLVGSQDGTVYALDLETGCAHWTFKADVEVRNAVNIALHDERYLALFGDIKGTVYAIDAADATEVWRTKVHDHPAVTLTGSPRLYKDRLYVPLSSKEWASAADPAYPCCTFRGGVVAVDVVTGEIAWTAYSISAEPAPTGEVNDAGAERYHPAGAPIWNSPTIDEKRGLLYVGTGEGYTSPAADTSDSVLAIDLETGDIAWSFQALAGDAWNMACFIGGGPNCPEENGPDMDIGAPPVLVTTDEDKELLIVGQKSADVFALDPDEKGKLIWRKKIGLGGFAGGVHWGMAAKGSVVFAPNADTKFTGRFKGERKPGLYALDAASGETLWFTPAPNVCAEEDKPACDPGLSAAVTATDDVVFAGAFDGHLRAYDAASGEILWDFNTNRTFETVSGETARGGSIESDGPVVINGHVLVNSGYLFGDRLPGNVLLAFHVPPQDD